MVSGTAGHTPAEAKPSLIPYRLFFWLTAAISLGQPGNLLSIMGADFWRREALQIHGNVVKQPGKLLSP